MHIFLINFRILFLETFRVFSLSTLSSFHQRYSRRDTAFCLFKHLEGVILSMWQNILYAVHSHKPIFKYNGSSLNSWTNKLETKSVQRSQKVVAHRNARKIIFSFQAIPPPWKLFAMNAIKNMKNYDIWKHSNVLINCLSFVTLPDKTIKQFI